MEASQVATEILIGIDTMPEFEEFVDEYTIEDSIHNKKID